MTKRDYKPYTWYYIESKDSKFLVFGQEGHYICLRKDNTYFKNDHFAYSEAYKPVIATPEQIAYAQYIISDPNCENFRTYEEFIGSRIIPKNTCIVLEMYPKNYMLGDLKANYVYKLRKALNLHNLNSFYVYKDTKGHENGFSDLGINSDIKVRLATAQEMALYEFNNWPVPIYLKTESSANLLSRAEKDTSGDIGCCPTCSGAGEVMEAKLYPSGHVEIIDTCPECDGEGFIGKKSANFNELIVKDSNKPETKTIKVELLPVKERR